MRLVPVNDAVTLARPFVLADSFPMIVAAIIVGIFCLSMIVVLGAWIAKDHG